MRNILLEMVLYKYSTIIGTFVFDESGILYQGDDKEIKKKFGDLAEPPMDKLKQLLRFLKKNVYLEQFRVQNLLKTKQQIRESVTEDMLVIQAIGTIQELDKAFNILVKRAREWYALFLPEYEHKISSNEEFVKSILTKNRKEILKELGVDEDTTMGKNLSSEDVKPLLELAKEANNILKLRESLVNYNEELMKRAAPNITAVAGALIGAKLISQAGSLKRLSEFPASTIQLLGAEKALFRHMKTGAKSPKHGILLQHQLVLGSPPNKRGRSARVLADKISIAAKVDYFKGDFIGDQLNEEIKKKLGS